MSANTGKRGKQNAMSAYMVDNAIPIKKELARREKLCAMTSGARLQAWWRAGQ